MLVMNMNYYVLGSKYEKGRNNWVDVFPKMREKQAVSVGWATEYDLSDYYGKSGSDIVNYLKGKNEPAESYNTLKLFLNLKPGDLIAVKDSGSPKGHQPYLSIRAYAVVVERDGEVYGYDPGNLGHLLNVEFIEDSSFIELPLGGYGRTIHRLTNPEHIKQIFSLYHQIPDTTGSIGGKTKTKTEISTNKQYRAGSAAYIANAAHNILQKKVYEYLRERFGKANVELEKDNIDITVNKVNVITIYEVKPYSSAIQCIREALGQLLFYSYGIRAASQQLAVVGPNKPSLQDRKFLQYVKDSMRLPIKYMDFEANKLTEH
jgi:hypothetical protein